MADETTRAEQSLTGGFNQPLTAVLTEDGGRQVVRYSTADHEPAGDADARLKAALAVIGAWSDLDWDELSRDLDRIRHENPPTPPVEA